MKRYGDPGEEEFAGESGTIPQRLLLMNGKLVRERTEGVLAMEDAALYQALHRLEARDWIAAEWGVSENNRRAKFYKLTAAGKKQLDAEWETWKRFSGAVEVILRDA